MKGTLLCLNAKEWAGAVAEGASPGPAPDEYAQRLCERHAGTGRRSRLPGLAGHGGSDAGGPHARWKRGLGRRAAGVQAKHGAGASPIVYNDLVIVSCERDEKAGSPAGSAWIAVDRRTGRIRWRYAHPRDANASYSTPCVFRDSQGRDQLVFTSNSHGIAAIDPIRACFSGRRRRPCPIGWSARRSSQREQVIATCGEGGGGIRLSAVRPPDPNSPSRAAEVYSLDRAWSPTWPDRVYFSLITFSGRCRGRPGIHQRPRVVHRCREGATRTQRPEAAPTTWAALDRMTELVENDVHEARQASEIISSKLRHDLVSDGAPIVGQSQSVQDAKRDSSAGSGR